MPLIQLACPFLPPSALKERISLAAAKTRNPEISASTFFLPFNLVLALVIYYPRGFDLQAANIHHLLFVGHGTAVVRNIY